MAEYPMRVVKVSLHWGGMQHLTIFQPRQIKSTLCGKRWEYVSNQIFNPKIDCQQCRKIQEALA